MNEHLHKTPGLTVPYVTLNDARSMPQLGFGVWQVENDKVGPAVREAIASGYRLIDTAQGYDNEQGVGQAIAEAGLPREDIFITSKLRTKLLGYEEAQEGIEQSLDALKIEYLDLFLIHWPAPAHDRYADAWRGLIKARERGLVRSIGVSNFLPEHLERIIGESGVVPAVNQLETHPHFQQRDVRDFHRRNRIQMEAYSPLGTGSTLDDPTIGEIAKRLERTPAQVILRWHLQEGRVAIPKSVTPERIKGNLEVFDFALSDDDMRAIAFVDDPTSGRTGSDPATFNDLY
jgi:2,5-diketo-D-gluconate reductase A